MAERADQEGKSGEASVLSLASAPKKVSRGVSFHPGIEEVSQSTTTTPPDEGAPSGARLPSGKAAARAAAYASADGGSSFTREFSGSSDGGSFGGSHKKARPNMKKRLSSFFGEKGVSSPGRVLRGRPEQRRTSLVRQRRESLRRQASLVLNAPARIRAVKWLFKIFRYANFYGHLIKSILVPAVTGLLMLGLRREMMVVIFSELIDAANVTSGADGTAMAVSGGRLDTADVEYAILSEHLMATMNEVAGGFLSAVGVVFGLLIAQVYGASSKRTEVMRELVTNEAGCLHRVFLLSDCMYEVPHSPQVDEHCKAINKSLETYAHALQREFADKMKLRWNEESVRQRRADDSAKLYSVMSAAAHVCGLQTETNTECNNKTSSASGTAAQAAAAAAAQAAAPDNAGAATLAQRIIETTEELITLRYRRSGEMQQKILTWSINFQLWFVSACLLWGVILLETGSRMMNSLLTLATLLTVEISLLAIAIMDLPFAGVYRVRFEDLCIVPEELVSKKKIAKHTRQTDRSDRGTEFAEEIPEASGRSGLRRAKCLASAMVGGLRISSRTPDNGSPKALASTCPPAGAPFSLAPTYRKHAPSEISSA